MGIEAVRLLPPSLPVRLERSSHTGCDVQAFDDNQCELVAQVKGHCKGRAVQVRKDSAMTTNESVYEEVIYRMTITRNGKTIRRKDGRPWKIVIRHKK